MSFWVKNTSGKKDAMLTFATISFIVVTLSVILSSISDLKIGNFSANFIPLDSGLASIYLGATFSAYVTRRWTDKHFGKEKMEDIGTMTSETIETAVEILNARQSDERKV